MWPVRNRCFRCGCPKGHDPAPTAAPSYAVGPTSRPSQRSNPLNPTDRPNQRPPQPVAPTASVQNSHPLNQPLHVGFVDAAASGSVPAFPAGSWDWLKNFLQQIMSPEDYLKYKSSFDSSERGGPACVATGQQNQGTGQCLGAD